MPLAAAQTRHIAGSHLQLGLHACASGKLTARLPVTESQTPTPPTSPATTPGAQRQNWLKFAIGFAGWYLANGLIWMSMFTPGVITGGYAMLGTWMCLIAANILVLLVLAIVRPARWVALGMLAALALNLAISLSFGLFMNAYCLIPFFIK